MIVVKCSGVVQNAGAVHAATVIVCPISTRVAKSVKRPNTNKTLFRHRQIRDCCPAHGCVQTIR